MHSLSEQKSGRTLLLILALSVILRGGVALYLGDSTPPAKDETSYSTLASRLATGYGYSFPTAWYPFASANTPTAHWSFAYPLYLVGVYGIFGVHPLAARLIQAALVGIATCLLVYSLTRRGCMGGCGWS